MFRTYALNTLVAVVLISGTPAEAQQPIVYPSKGQTPELQKKDQAECNAWAQQTTGVDPLALAQQSANQPAPSGPQGERARGAVRGAAAGAAIGAVAGDAGKGAAIGATAGTLRGGAQQRQQANAAQQQQQQSQQQTQQSLATYSRAVNACMEGRGYTIK